MKKHFFYFSFPIACIVALISCKNTSDNPEKVKTLDSLLQVVTYLEKELYVLDSSGIDAKAGKLDEIYSSLNENKPDTATKEEGLVIEQFNARKKVFDTYRAKKSLFFERIVFAKKQLHDLAHDIDKNLVEEENLGAYFDAEVKKANGLIESAQLTINGMKELVTNFDSSNVAINDLVVKLKATKDSITTLVK